jgi:hypothetical protein
MAPLHDSVKPDTTPANHARLVDLPESVKNSIKEALGIRPKKWRRRTNAPYYKPHFAEMLKVQCLNPMMESMEDFCYFYKDVEHKMGKNSLYLFINQAIRFISEPENNVDPEGKYRKFLDSVTITREAGVGVRLSIHRDAKTGNTLEFKPRKVQSKSEVPKYRIKIDEFLENGEEGDMLELKDLALSPSQIEEINQQLAGIQSVQSKVETNAIRLIKLTLE